MKNRLLFLVTLLVGICFSAGAFGPWKSKQRVKAKADKKLALTMDAYAATVNATNTQDLVEEEIPDTFDITTDEDFPDEEEMAGEELEQEAEEEREELAQPTFAMDVDIEVKREKVIALVNKGASYLQKQPIQDVMQAFSHDKKFVNGELYLFVYDTKGTCFAHGQEGDLVWQNLYNKKDRYGTLIIQEIIKTAKSAPGWITYQWRNSTKVSYVRLVQKDGKTFVIGSGYYPHSKEDAVVGMVKGAVALFNDVIAQGRQKEEAFATFSYPMGRFVFGDLYLYALDFDGIHYAHGELPGIIGTNGWNYRDSRGKYVNQEIISRLKETSGGVLVEYFSRGAPKLAYAEKVTDKTGKNYFVACGYYPESDRNNVVNLVKKGYRFMKASGKTAAAREFSDKSTKDYRFGDLTLFVYDMKGKCIAHGGNPSFVGSNQYDLQDEDGRYYIRELIEKGKAGGGWVDYKIKNAFQTTYVEKVDLGIEDFIIGSGLFPVSKRETMLLLAKSSAAYLRTNPEEAAFGEFVKKTGRFIRGDLDIMVFDMSGICYAYGDDYDLIWRNLFNQKDDAGKPFVKMFINTVKRGPGTVTYTLNGATKMAYVESVDKGGVTYVVGSSFYL